MLVAWFLFFLAFPAAVIWLCYRFSFLNKIGAVIICYIVGITLGNTGVIPEAAVKMPQDLSEAAVALAIPLLLFSMDVRRWLKIAGKAIFSMAGASLAIIAVAACAVYLTQKNLPDAWKLGGMAIGVYTGGTPNLAAIKEALHVDATTFIIMHTYDTVVSLVYIVFCMTIAQPLFNRLLPRFAQTNRRPDDVAVVDESIGSYGGIFSAKIIRPLAGVIILVLVIVALSLGVISVLPKSYATAAGILVLTTGGIIGSFIPKIRKTEKTFQVGMYFILIFCLAVGSMANLKDIININWPIMFLVFFCIACSFLVHAVFCRIFKIDTDTFIITSVSAICSPPFVPPVAAALKNKEVLLSGITTGIIGYAIGNYLGISFAYIFRQIFG